MYVCKWGPPFNARAQMGATRQTCSHTVTGCVGGRWPCLAATSLAANNIVVAAAVLRHSLYRCDLLLCCEGGAVLCCPVATARPAGAPCTPTKQRSCGTCRQPFQTSSGAPARPQPPSQAVVAGASGAAQPVPQSLIRRHHRCHRRRQPWRRRRRKAASNARQRGGATRVPPSCRQAWATTFW